MSIMWYGERHFCIDHKFCKVQPQNMWCNRVLLYKTCFKREIPWVIDIFLAIIRNMWRPTKTVLLPEFTQLSIQIICICILWQGWKDVGFVYVMTNNYWENCNHIFMGGGPSMVVQNGTEWPWNTWVELMMIMM